MSQEHEHTEVPVLGSVEFDRAALNSGTTHVALLLGHARDWNEASPQDIGNRMEEVVTHESFFAVYQMREGEIEEHPVLEAGDVAIDVDTGSVLQKQELTNKGDPQEMWKKIGVMTTGREQIPEMSTKSERSRDTGIER